MARIGTIVMHVAVVGSLAATAVAQSPPFDFIDVSDGRGIGPYQMAEGMGAGVAAADFDADGDVDFFVPTALGMPDQLYENLGDGEFEEIAGRVGLDSRERNRVALWIDYDADGDLDLLVANDREDASSTYRFYAQSDRGFFVDVTKRAGFDQKIPPRFNDRTAPHRGGLCAGDVNGDGWLDVYSAQWNGYPRLFVHNGDPRNPSFVDVTRDSGVLDSYWAGHQPMMADFDRDGDLDIYAAIDFLHNSLFLNNGCGVFVDVAPDIGVDNAMNDMGMTLGDYDNDGDLDVYVTNIYTAFAYNIMLRNDTVAPNIAFTEVSVDLKTDEGGWAWGTTFLDADNDGWLDIAATNGWETPNFTHDRSRFFWNRLGAGDDEFLDVSDDVHFNDTEWGSTLVAFDADRDGDLDLLQSCKDGPLRLLDNQRHVGTLDHNYLVVQPRMVAPNRFAIGAIVRVRVGVHELMRPITAGTSYLGQEPAEAFFGLGAAEWVDSLRIEWPDGAVTVLNDIAAGQVLVVERIIRPGGSDNG